MMNGQIDTQPLHRNLSILFLAAAFRCFTLNAGRRVCDDDRRLDFIAMLAARPATTLATSLAVGEQSCFV